ncbi:NYN domain-containing protein [Candidatus Dependentiae bacterium]|nr:NYN domain-containing protein [Candidatus Dependentiae bacterium]
MILIIDGYNVLKYCVEKSRLHQNEREQFIFLLKRYAALKKMEIVLVFDGGPLGLPDKETHGSVRVIYTGKAETADEFIVNYCERHKGGGIVTVSSDREIINAARRFGIETISAQEFFHYLKDALTKPKDDSSSTRAIKISDKKDEPDVDQLMHYGSLMRPTKKDDKDSSREPAGKDLAKNEKRRLQKLKKL